MPIDTPTETVFRLVTVTVLVRLNVFTAWAPKAKFTADKYTGGSPVPRRANVCGLLAALSLIVRLLLAAPLAVGVKVTVIVHLAPAATLLPQVFVCEKAPPAAMALKVKAAVPLLVRVTLAALLLPTTVGLNTRDEGASDTDCACATATTSTSRSTAGIPTRQNRQDDGTLIEPLKSLVSILGEGAPGMP